MSGRGGRPPGRGGLLSGMSVPPMASMPKIRTAFTRGLAATWSSPLVVGATIGWILVEWLVLVALGFPGPFATLAYVSAPAPLSTPTDLLVSTGTIGLRLGFVLVFVVAIVHALWFSLVAGLAVEAIETGSATRWGAIRGLRAFPVSFAMHVIGIPVLFASQIAAGVGGGSLSLVLQIAIMVLAVWALAFAPVIAIAERRRLTETLGRSFRAARLPGSGNLSFATIYTVPVFATLIAILVGGVPGAVLDVNPRYSAWIFVVLMNFLHVSVVAALSMRYLSVAGEVAEPPPRPSRSARGAPAKATTAGASTRRKPRRR